MAIIYFSYLFDAKEFYKTMSSLVDNLERGDYQPLYQLARQTLATKPKLWNFLDSLGIGPQVDSEDLEQSVGAWLTMAQVQFLQPIAEFGPDGGWTFLKIALPLIKWEENDINLLLFGKSLCTLLIPDKKYKLDNFKDHPQNTPWCAGYTNWLDLSNVERLYQQLVNSQEVYFELAEQPQSIQQQIYLKDKVKPPLEWYKEGLRKDFADMMRILTTARKAQKSLAMAII